MSGRIVTYCSVLSLVLCVATYVTWRLSCTEFDGDCPVLRFCGVSTKITTFSYGTIEIELGWARITRFDASTEADPKTFALAKSAALLLGGGGLRRIFDGRKYHVHFIIDHDGGTSTYPDAAGNDIDMVNPWRIETRWWILATIFGLLPLAVATVRLKRFATRRCPAHSSCPTCGYDLRATPSRCPECGKVPRSQERVESH